MEFVQEPPQRRRTAPQRPTPDFPKKHAGCFEDRLHKTLQNHAQEEDTEDLGDDAHRHRSHPPAASSPPWRTLAETPRPPPRVGIKKNLAESFFVQFGVRGGVGQLFRRKPTRDSQVLRATRRSPIIGLDTLPLQASTRPAASPAAAAGVPTTARPACLLLDEGSWSCLSALPFASVLARPESLTVPSEKSVFATPAFQTRGTCPVQAECSSLSLYRALADS